MQAKNQFEVRNQADDTAELLLYGIIGDYWEDLDAKDVIMAIRSIDAKAITVKIHSEGGSVFAGLAIYNALMDHPAAIVVHIDALAASVASVIAMAGDVVEMPGNAFLMIHNPWVMAVGDEKEIARAMAMLVKIKSSLISVYEHKTGMSTNDLSAMMDEETWLIAEEAVQLGFADKIVGTAKVNNMAFYNQLTNFRKVPDAIKNLANVPAGRRPDEPSTKETNMQLTIEKVKAEHPDIAKALIDEGLAQGMQEGAKNELERVLAVQAQTMPGHEKLIAELVADGKTTGPEAAVKVLAAEKQIRLNAQASLDADGVDPVAHNNPPDGNDPPADDEDLPIEERAKAEWDKDGKLRKEFSGDFKVYLAYRKNEINVRSIGK